ncbi:acyl carrier protein [Streptomyces sp. TG1A-8]|uniref:acyl carrier protein n=1 Tax=Streptomyces sp. TG1A-8 TaxID=3051385 RepID=UPI00265BD869|nr:phosphopantetheine-binding protein [Streptomyces sp. TG1A-8]MDO0924671.1 acyl carrier protein [Streptomyces sp. TG1A-8]
MTTEATTTTAPGTDESTVLAQIAAMLRELPDAGLEDAEIGRETLFHDNLELESIDLVSLAGVLREHYGERVNLALFIADLELDEIIALTVGQLADYVAASLRAAEEG